MKPRKPFTESDLRYSDLELLAKAYALQPEEFICQGKSYFKLVELGLMSPENQITYEGRQFIWNWQKSKKN